MKVHPRLAEAIVDELMTAGDGTMATRLALRRGSVLGVERDLGGLCRDAAVARVSKVLLDRAVGADVLESQRAAIADLSNEAQVLGIYESDMPEP